VTGQRRIAATTEYTILFKEPAQKPPATLGDVLYARSRPSVLEQDWERLVQSIAAGNQLALYALYERAHRPVFTLIMRLTARLETAEELTLEVFHDAWHHAAHYDAANSTVLGWIMNQARSRTIDYLHSINDYLPPIHEKQRGQDGEALPVEPAAAPRDVLELRRQGESLRAALTALTQDERQAIEMTFFAGRTHAEASVWLNQPFGAIKTHIRSALYKLWNALVTGQETINSFRTNRCNRSEVTCAYAVQALAPNQAFTAEIHIASCPECRQELASLGPVINRFICWPTNVLRPPRSLQARLALRIAAETGRQPPPPERQWSEPEWEQVAPGIECKLLATDTKKHRVSMLVRLAPGASYPAHTHAGPEELHLLDGELWIDGRKLVPGAYNYGAPGSGDDHVWSETGCSCVLITSTKDVLQ
jgi:RNA polymerase sigma factor (sigma-70 family)